MTLRDILVHWAGPREVDMLSDGRVALAWLGGDYSASGATLVVRGGAELVSFATQVREPRRPPARQVADLLPNGSAHRTAGRIVGGQGRAEVERA